MAKGVPQMDGGPAFPFEADNHPGMSLRDWFAGQIIAAVMRERLKVPKQTVGDPEYTHWAQVAYRIADAMVMEYYRRS